MRKTLSLFTAAVMALNGLLPLEARSQAFNGPGCCCPPPTYQMVQRTIMVPTWEDQMQTIQVTKCRPEMRQATYTCYEQVPVTQQVQQECTVMVPQVQSRQINYMVCRPITRQETRQITVMVPSLQTCQGVRMVCDWVPQTQTATVCEDQGHWETVTCGGAPAVQPVPSGMPSSPSDVPPQTAPNPAPTAPAPAPAPQAAAPNRTPFANSVLPPGPFYNAAYQMPAQPQVYNGYTTYNAGGYAGYNAAPYPQNAFASYGTPWANYYTPASYGMYGGYGMGGGYGMYASYGGYGGCGMAGGCGMPSCYSCCAPCVSQRWVPNLVQKQVSYTCMRPQPRQVPFQYQVTVCKPEVRTVTVPVCDYVQEAQTRTISYTIMVPQKQTRTVNVVTCQTVPRQQTYNYTVSVPYQETQQIAVRVCKMVPKTICCQVPCCP